MGVQPNLTATELVDEYFIENRTRILEIGAFLDRLHRLDPAYSATDFRMKAFLEALAKLKHPGADRVLEIQRLMSDPSVEPIAALDRKSAIGAYDHWQEARG